MIFNDENHLITYYKNLELPLCSCVIYRMDSNGNPVTQGGVTLERQVPGYRTEETSGRDSLETDITELEYPHLDGAKYQSKKKQSRDITIKYKLVSTTPEIHRKKLLKLRSILFGSELEYSCYRFRDEADVYYIGTIKSLTEAKFVRNIASEGEITIHCSDPFKYSVEVFEQKAVKNEKGKYTFKIDYNGTYPSSPKFITRQNSGENGYIAFTDEQSHIVQAGDPNEKDSQYVRKNAEDIDVIDFGKTSLWAKGEGWWGNLFTAPTINKSKAAYVEGALQHRATGFTRTANSNMPDGTGTWVEKTTPTKNEYWHGPSMFHKVATKKYTNMISAVFDYAFAKQSNGEENMQGGMEFILFGVDPGLESQPAYSGWNLKQIAERSIKAWTHPTIKGKNYTSWPLVRICIKNSVSGSTACKAWIQAYTGDSSMKANGNISFDCRMPLPLKAKPTKAGWVEWTPGKWSYWNGKKWLKGWQKLRDSKGTFWFYLDSQGYALGPDPNGNADAKTGVYLLNTSKGQAHFHFNSRMEMTANASASCTVNGVAGTYKFNKDGWLETDVPVAGWRGSGYLWRYYVTKSGKLVYLTGWQKIDKKWYYFTSNGYTVHGWQKLKWNGKENTYYFNSSCAMVTGDQVIGGTKYTFNSQGALTSGQNVKLTASSNTTRSSSSTTPTDVFYKMSKKKLTIEVLRDGVLNVTLEGKTYTYKNAFPVDSEGVPRVIFTGIGIQMYAWKNNTTFDYTQAKINAGTPVGVQYIDKVDIKRLESPLQDIKNSFGKGSICTIDCGTGDIYLGDAKKPSLGALGNDYETLKIVPRDGTQEIQCLFSGWVKSKDEPDFTIQYREVYI